MCKGFKCLFIVWPRGFRKIPKTGACHAPGGYFTDSKNKKQACGNGNYADIGIFSFHPVKHIACGEGGMITTNSETHYKKLTSLRSHGITKEHMSCLYKTIEQVMDL